MYTVRFHTTGLPNTSAPFWVSSTPVHFTDPSASDSATTLGPSGIASGTNTIPSAIAGVLSAG